MDRTTMVVSLVHCLSTHEDDDGFDRNCDGCPLHGEEGCMYDLKMAVLEELLKKPRILAPEKHAEPYTFDEIFGGEFNA